MEVKGVFAVPSSLSLLNLRSLQFRQWTSDFRHQTFPHSKLTLVVFSNFLEILPVILHIYSRLMSEVYGLMSESQLRSVQTLTPYTNSVSISKILPKCATADCRGSLNLSMEDAEERLSSSPPNIIEFVKRNRGEISWNSNCVQ